jgi:hypothetical protein
MIADAVLRRKRERSESERENDADETLETKAWGHAEKHRCDWRTINTGEDDAWSEPFAKHAKRTHGANASDHDDIPRLPSRGG